MTTSSLVEVQAKLAAIESSRAGIIGRRNELGGRIETVERQAGELYLSGDRSAAKELIEFRTEVDLCERALVVLDQQEKVARADLKRATAADMRRQAAERRSRLDALQKQTRKFLAELSRLEGVDYGPAILTEQRTGTWYENFKGVTPAANYLPTRDCFPDPTGENRGTFADPLSSRLRRDAVKLELEAEQIEIEIASAELPASTEVSRWTVR